MLVVKWLSVCAQHVYCKVVVTCYSFRGASDVWYSRCRNRARVGLSVGINSVTVNVPSNKVRVVIVLTKNVKIISLVL